MERARATIAEACRMVDDTLHHGFSISDIPELATMIKSVERIEKYIDGMAPAEEAPMDETAWLLKNISNELHAAEKYYKHWEASQNATYKTLAHEECKHAESLIRAAKTQALTKEQEAKLQELIMWYQALAGKLN